MAYVYFIQNTESGHIKIGRTTGNVQNRQRQIAKDLGVKRTVLVIVGVIVTKQAVELEAELHGRFSSFNVKGEWFNPDSTLTTFIKENTEDWDEVYHRQKREREIGRRNFKNSAAYIFGKGLQFAPSDEAIFKISEIAKAWKTDYQTALTYMVNQYHQHIFTSEGETDSE